MAKFGWHQPNIVSEPEILPRHCQRFERKNLLCRCAENHPRHGGFWPRFSMNWSRISKKNPWFPMVSYGIFLMDFPNVSYLRCWENLKEPWEDFPMDCPMTCGASVKFPTNPLIFGSAAWYWYIIGKKHGDTIFSSLVFLCTSKKFDKNIMSMFHACSLMLIPLVTWFKEHTLPTLRS